MASEIVGYGIFVTKWRRTGRRCRSSGSSLFALTWPSTREIEFGFSAEASTPSARGLKTAISSDRGAKGTTTTHTAIFIDPDDNIWLTDSQIHVVEKRRQNGELLLELGTRGHAMPTTSQKADNGETPSHAEGGVAEPRWRHIRVGTGTGTAGCTVFRRRAS